MHYATTINHQVMELVRELVGSVWPEADVQAYGSFYTGLELPSSDVDVVVCGIAGRRYVYGEKVKNKIKIKPLLVSL
jgi:DNA polymerase sigma